VSGIGSCPPPRGGVGVDKETKKYIDDVAKDLAKDLTGGMKSLVDTAEKMVMKHVMDLKEEVKDLKEEVKQAVKDLDKKNSGRAAEINDVAKETALQFKVFTVKLESLEKLHENLENFTKNMFDTSKRSK
jgi:dsDNA-specific endonuclease/ATPase MutS2